ncbi:hypothetical protein AVEN_211554-1 [Araneus ventricosus]|uniref:DUF4817 domain-containing protein n=1 Tax=Araneus ventricosus TaxID=182803 RepID=A0A4Y2D8D7_ARAVE|nr:hypothetical protein AVEN_211554-1 [Araneus ventricosus]
MYENASEVERQYRREFQEDLPTLLTVNWIKDKLETNGTVQDVHDNVPKDQECQQTLPDKKDHWKVITKHPKNLCGIVIRFRFQALMVPGSNPDSTKDPPCILTCCMLNLTSSVKRPQIALGVVRKFGEGVTARVLFSSSDCGSKL